VLAMYEMYANSSTEASADSPYVLDRWITARVYETIQQITDGYESYELDKATRPLEPLIDDLSVWYLRRSRERLKSDSADKALALGTLRFVLRHLALLMAPVMPFYAEYLWGRVRDTDDVESVHLAEWPTYGTVDAGIIEEMRITRLYVSLGLEARMRANIKVRQPLSKLMVKTALHKEAEPFLALMREELNVKAIVHEPTLAEEVALDTTVTPELKTEGDAREFIRQVQELRKKAGLEPKDQVKLSVQTSGGGEEILRSFEDTIKKVTGAAMIEYSCASGDEIIAGNHSFTIALTKL
jgi:isoleucyl-tRNA synthetase